MTSETAIAKTQPVEEQSNQEPAITPFVGRPIASNEIDKPEELMGFLD